MTRTLPWLKGPSTSTPQGTHTPRDVAPRAKRRKVVEPSSDGDDDNKGVMPNSKALNIRASSLPTLEAPSESLMDEGLDKDDRFRMVEDEFLDVAKQFTQYLHAAEYQRLKKAARSQSAAVINSISRPVSIRMPPETRRKVESVARAKKQADAVKSLVRKQDRGSGSDEDSDSHGGAWLGTALHGLMESPRKSAAALMKVGKTTAFSRAAAGIDNARPSKSSKDSPSPLQDLESFSVDEKAEPRKRDSCESSTEDDDDDDLDAPIRSRPHPTLNPLTTSRMTTNSRILKEGPNTTASTRNVKSFALASSSKIVEHDIENTSNLVSTSSRERIAKRLEQARIQRSKEEQEAREKLEIIPMFLQ